MLQDAKRSLSYICPDCRQSVVVARSVFELAAGVNHLTCPCGHSELTTEMMGDRVRLTVPCLFCQRSHSVECSTHAFLHEKALAFACADSGLDCCYVGEEGPVFAATRRLEETVDKLEADAGSRGVFLDELVMQEVLAEVRDIAQRGGVSCTCGSKQWNLRIKHSSVELSCPDCGGTLRIPAAVADDIESICCKNTLLIPGKKG